MLEIFVKIVEMNLRQKITVGYWDYKSTDIFVSGGAPLFGEPVKSVTIIENVCLKCMEKRIGEEKNEN